ncbi:MAG: energy-coupled thiamine transporter ThiT [Mobilitalea sp.]
MFEKVLEFLATKEIYSETEVYYTPTFAGNMVLALLIVLLFIAMAAFSGYKKKVRAKQLAFSAMAVTLAVVTSFVKIVSLPFGGSITLFSMFFICLIGYLYGTKAGIITGIAYGFLQLILGPTVIHPLQLLLDYPIAFGCLGLTGILANTKNGIIKGYLLGVAGRFLCHFISGYLFFPMYTPEGMNPIVYSLGYNATYIVPEAIATILILLIPAIQNALREVKRMANEVN